MLHTSWIVTTKCKRNLSETFLHFVAENLQNVPKYFSCLLNALHICSMCHDCFQSRNNSVFLFSRFQFLVTKTVPTPTVIQSNTELEKTKH